MAAALLLEDGFIFTQPPPARHHTLVHRFCRITGRPFTSLDSQGFLLSTGTFAERELAARVALASGQLDRLNHPPNLYSEDLW
ncbi:MAG: hypothetical protein GWO44_22245 [Thermoplasmata archaeon]|nr:hypothetical protein [Thermoplasmata archaeon]NIY05904.1 hypothetical protein [Thermoplasmata archaeon]